ncbi:MAG TPA: MIP/aquaporin family protein [Chloroflexota bacterium]
MAATMERPRINVFTGVMGEAMGEFLGTMVLILFGDGCVAGVLLYGVGGVTSNGVQTLLWTNWMIIAFGWGIGVMLGVYVAGTLSGAHLNPAVTLAFAAVGRFPWSKVIPYIIAQVAGAFVAAAILWAVYHGAFMAYEAAHHVSKDPTEFLVFATAKKPFVGMFGAFGDEFLGTALLVGLIFAIVDIRNSPPGSNLAPYIIGFLVVAIGLSFGYNTGYAINPARDFGPRLLAAIVGFNSNIALPGPDNYFWIPIVGPITGGIVGGAIYEYTVHQALLSKLIPPSGTVEEIGVTDREAPRGT